MTAAVFGLIGVVVGGVLNGLVALVMDGRRDARAVMGAARLVLEEVSGFSATYSTALEQGTWSTIPQWPLRLGQWEEYRTLIASRVSSSSEWRKLSAPFLDAREINELAATKQPHAALNPPARKILEASLNRTNEAIPVLAPYVRGEHLWAPRLKRNLGIPPKTLPQAEQAPDGPESTAD